MHACVCVRAPVGPVAGLVTSQFLFINAALAFLIFVCICMHAFVHTFVRFCMLSMITCGKSGGRCAVASGRTGIMGL